MKYLFVALAASVATAAVSAPLVDADYSACEKTLAGVKTNGGKASVFVENGNWNRCGKLQITSVQTNAQGVVSMCASAWVGCEGDQNGFAVKTNAVYRFSVEIRGEAPKVGVEYIEWVGPHTWKDMRARRTSVGTVKVHPNWVKYEGTFKTSDKAVRAALHLQLFSSTAYGPLQHKVGDYVLFDNVRIEEAPVLSLDELAKTTGLPYAVARVNPTDPMSVPFVPAQLFEPQPEKFRLVAAVNERKPLPIAIANLTDRPAEYRVTLENGGDPAAARTDLYYSYHGRRGLDGFPEGNVTLRRAAVIRDADGADAGACLDPLPKMDEASLLQVPPKEARLVWIDLDTTGVKPGKYAGRLRVVPLEGAAEWKSAGGFDHRKYVGPGRDWPVELKVLPITLPKDPPVGFGFFQGAANEKMFQSMLDFGMREVGITPYAFPFGRREPDLAGIRNQLAWAKARDVKLTWFVGFSCYHSLNDVLGVKPFADEAAHLAAFVDWLGKVKAAMNGLGISDAEYLIEAWDEPEKKMVPTILNVLQEVRRRLPTMRMCLTLGAQGCGMDALEQLAPFVDGWVLWDYGYFDRPDCRAFIRRALAAGKHVSHYTCSTRSTMLRSDRYRGYRQRPWIAEANGLTGNDLFWFSDAAGGYGSQDWKVTPWGQIVYRSFDDFIPSVRAMAYREGQTDIRYLAALRAAAPKDAAVRAFLEEAGRKVVYDYGHDSTMADRLRKQAAELILERTK